MSDLFSFGGHYPPHWLGNLTGHLALRGIDIVSLRAERSSQKGWTVELSVAGRGQLTLQELDLLARVQTQKVSQLRPRLTTFHTEFSEEGLILSVRGENRLGFLAHLCADLAAFALFPVRADIFSHGEEVNDTLWLVALGGHLPHRDTKTALSRFLESWQRGELAGRRSSVPPNR